MRFIKLTLLITFLAINLSACGKKGPLYLPGDNDQAAQNTPANFALINSNS